jgi:hypothetical protein
MDARIYEYVPAICQNQNIKHFAKSSFMSIHKMPLAWSDNRLARNPEQMITTYQFQPVRGGFVCEFPDHEYKSFCPYKLADLLVADGLEDGTVQFKRGRQWPIEREESLHGMAALSRISNRRLIIPHDRISTLFRKSCHRLRPDVQEWWDDTLGAGSRAWRVRRYSFQSPRRVTKLVGEFLEFGSDADMLAFKFRWPELWS